MSDLTEVTMPSMGEGVVEATLVKWLKSPGDKVDKDEPLLEVATDKVDTEIPAPVAGVVTKFLFEEGATIKVNEVIATISSIGGAVASKEPTNLPSGSGESANSTKPVTFDGGSRMANSQADSLEATRLTNQKASPIVRKMAKEHNVDLSLVSGSGIGGRIVKKDLEVHMASGSKGQTSQARQTTGEDSSHVVLGRLQTQVQDGKEYLDGVLVRREKMSQMRRLIAEHMVQSVRTSPHVTTVFEMDLHKVESIRGQWKGRFLSEQGFKLTLTPFLLYATVAAIKRHPIVNCSVDGDAILHKSSINLGVAVALPHGLIVPVIKNAEDLSLLGIAKRLNDLAERARSKKLMADDVRGGTFSVTNPGMFGCITSNPIINQPQVAILGIGALEKKAVVINDMIGIRPKMYISLTFDHRVVDGEGGALFLKTLKEQLEGFDSEPI